MLRINLLPSYVNKKHAIVKWYVLSGLLVAGTAAAFIAWLMFLNNEQTTADQAKSEAEAHQSRFNSLNTDIAAERQKVAAIKERADFLNNALTYNKAWPQTYAQLRDFISPRILLNSMNIAEDRRTVNISGFCPDEDHLIRWWMYLRDTGYFSQIRLNLPQHSSTPNTQGASINLAGGDTDFGGGAPPSLGTSAGSGGPRGGFGFGGGGGNNNSGVGPTVIEGRSGLNFTAVGVLQQQLAGGIATPSWPPGSATTAGGGGGFTAGGAFGSGGPSSSGFTSPGSGGGGGKAAGADF